MNIHTESKKSIWKGIFENFWVVFQIISVWMGLVIYLIFSHDICAIVADKIIVSPTGEIIATSEVNPIIQNIFPPILTVWVLFWFVYLLSKIITASAPKSSDK